MREAMRRDRTRAKASDEPSTVQFQVFAGPYPGPSVVAPTPPRAVVPTPSAAHTTPDPSAPTTSNRRRPTPDSRSPAVATDWHTLNMTASTMVTTLDATVFSGLQVSFTP